MLALVDIIMYIGVNMEVDLLQIDTILGSVFFNINFS